MSEVGVLEKLSLGPESIAGSGDNVLKIKSYPMAIGAHQDSLVPERACLAIEVL